MLSSRMSKVLADHGRLVSRTIRYSIRRHSTITHRQTFRSATVEKDETDIQTGFIKPAYTPAPSTAGASFAVSNLSLPLHDSLDSFLRYAEKTNLDSSSTVFRGTKYEYTCLNSLTRLGFNLKRVGGANDAGIDLLGSWNVPNSNTGLKALVQCKFLKKGISPVLVRELEGAFAGLPNPKDVAIGILCTPSLATKAVRETIRKSPKPIILAYIDEAGWVETIVWNDLSEQLAADLAIGLRYVDGRKEAILMYQDQPWFAEHMKPQE